MDIRQNVSLRDYSTMRLGGTAAYMVDVHDRHEVQQAVTWAKENTLPVMMIGQGSNIVWRDEGYPGLILIDKIMGFDERQEDDENYFVNVGSGENWDSVVARTVAKGMTGIECLSLIPGTAGATPVQNVGAYGQEISQVLVSLEAYDSEADQMINIPGMDCALTYRSSRFKLGDRGRFFITGILLHLRHATIAPPLYSALQSYLDEHNMHDYSPAAIREAVIAIRSSKLPDPAVIGNNGSFFANPIVDEGQFEYLRDMNEQIPHWPTDDGRVKIPAAWLIEQVGFKDMHDPETGMATWPAQPLVLVNEHAQSTAQLLQFRQKIIDAVHQKFNITLEQEPELLP